MLQLIADYAVPLLIVLLMLAAGTDITSSSLHALRRSAPAVFIGSAGQLLLLPLLAVLIVKQVAFEPTVAAGIVLLSLCPGGGISNTYCHLARCDVLLSATITATGTLLSLVTIPMWLNILPGGSGLETTLGDAPAGAVVSQLFSLILVPLGGGMLVRQAWPVFVERNQWALRTMSLALVLAVLAVATWLTREDLTSIATDVAVGTILFVVGAMAMGALTSIFLTRGERAVIIVESATRNIGIALLLGRELLPDEGVGAVATFLTGYLIVEIVVMLGYVHVLANRSESRSS